MFGDATLILARAILIAAPAKWRAVFLKVQTKQHNRQCQAERSRKLEINKSGPARNPLKSTVRTQPKRATYLLTYESYPDLCKQLQLSDSVCVPSTMSYTELEHGYQGLRNAAGPPQFYVGGVSYEPFPTCRLV